MKMRFFFSVLVFNVSICAAVVLQSLHLKDPHSYLTRDVHWFTQKLDHFTATDSRTFSQRYYEFTDFFKDPSGPVFLRICGEGPCNGIQNDYSSVLAKRFGAAVVCLEHRYYGHSSPFPKLHTENLKYLSSKQALFDLATFRDYYQELINSRGNSNSSRDNPWFVFGVSYPGALSAWFKLKFPHLVVGSIASSGVVQAIFDFTKFDEQVAESAGSECTSALREVTRLADLGLKENSLSTKALFGAEQLEIDGDFMYLLADAAAIAFQYGNPEKLCSPLVAASKQDLLAVYAKYVKEYYIGTFGSSVDTYDQNYLKNYLDAGDSSSSRLWWYQVCTEVAYFQAAPEKNSIRSSLVSVKYHLDLCSNVFGKGTYPEVDTTNLYYGGNKIAGTRILFMNGSQDPWRHASKQNSTHGEPAVVIKCQNCAHGVDMRGCPQTPLQIEGNSSKCGDPEAVERGREVIIKYISRWLHGYNRVISAPDFI